MNWKSKLGQNLTFCAMSKNERKVKFNIKKRKSRFLDII